MMTFWPGLQLTFRAVFIFAFSIGFCSQIHCQIGSDSILPAEGLVEDLQLLKMRILESHQNPFTYCSEEEFNSAFDNAIDSVLEGRTFLEFAGIVASTLQVIKDSHTYLNFSQLGKYYKNQGGLFLNFSIVTLDNGHIIVTKDGQEIIPEGSQLFTVNGHNLYEIYDEVKKYSIYEGNSEIGNRRIADAIFPSLVSMIIDVDSINKVEYKSLDDPLPSRVDYPAKTFDDLQKESKNRWKITPKTERKKTYDLTFYPEDSLAVLKIGSFIQGKNGKYYRFLNRSFRQIRKSNAKYLAIDLRNNTGGRTNRMEEVFNYFSEERFTVPRVIIARQSEVSKANYDNKTSGMEKFFLKLFYGNQEEAENYLKIMDMPIGETDTLYYYEADKRARRNFFDGQTYLLTNGRTGSAAVNFTGCFQYYQLGEIIGEPCLGPNSGTWGNPAAYQMKNSGLDIMISTIRSNNFIDFNYDPSPIEPKYYVPYNRRDIADQTDTQLEFLKGFLKKMN